MNQVYSYNSVEAIPDLKASAAFTVDSSEVFREQEDMNPVTIADGYIILGAKIQKVLFLHALFAGGNTIFRFCSFLYTFKLKLYFCKF